MKKKTVVLLVVILAFCTLVVGVLGFIFFRFRAAKKQRSEQPPRPVEVIEYDAFIDWQERFIYEYDGLGNVTKEICIDKDGTVVTLFEYDARNNFTKKTVMDEDSTDVTVYENEYDTFGLLKQQFTFSATGQDPQWVKKYYYDYWGNLKRVCERKPKDTLFFEEYTDIRYRYDFAGNVIWEKHFAHDNYQRYLLTYQYDDKGTLLSQTKYDYYRKLSIEDENIYDECGLLLETIHSFPFSETGELLSYKTKYTYDSKGRCIKEVTFDEDEVFDWKEYRYE